MPNINPVVMFEILDRLQQRLYDIYLITNNLEIADAIRSEVDYVNAIKNQIEPLIQ